jgi:hypothetical protein
MRNERRSPGISLLDTVTAAAETVEKRSVEL